MTDFDVVVIGGGAAGLSAALVLSRARRRVLVVDSGMPRNAPASEMHGFLSRDGFSPSDLLELGREEVAGYGGQIVDAAVERVETRQLELSGSPRQRPFGFGSPAGRRDRLARRASGDPGAAGAVGARCAPLPLLPRLRGARPGSRGARLGARGGDLRADRPSVVERRRVLRVRHNPDRDRTRRTGCSVGHRR